MKVLVVGGGVIGCSAAWELAKAGCAVTLFERSGPGAEASGAAAGMLSPLGEAGDALHRDLLVKSWRLYPAVVDELRERTGIDVEYVSRGSIYPLLTTEDVRRAEARARWAPGREFGIEAWDADEARAHEPALAATVRGAMFVKAAHWLNNQRLVVAYAQAAVNSGVLMRAGCMVSRVLVEDGHARGVVVDGERWEGDVVLLAAGAWTAALAASFGARLPVEPKRGQMLALAHFPPVVTYCVHSDDVYLVPRPSGELLVGATVERVGFQRAVTAHGIAGLLNAALQLAPALASLPISRTWYGFRPWAPDGLPILGPWPGIEGLFVATAHYRNGLMLAPITATLLREWITTGRPSIVPRAFLPDRFLTRRRP